MAEKEKTRSAEEEEGLKIGRILGAASRWGSRELIAELRALSKKKKRKSYEIIAEALELYRFVEDIGNVDPKALAASMFLIERHLELAIKLLASASSIFTSELVQSMMEAYNKIDQARAHTQPQQGSGQEIDIRSILLPLVTQLLQNIISTLPKSQQHSGVAGVKIIE